MSAVDENGDYQVDKLEVGDIWYFPKGAAHTVQGLHSIYCLSPYSTNPEKVLQMRTSISSYLMMVCYYVY